MRILVFNQYYPPDNAATAQLLGDLCAGLAERHEVTVICGRPSYDPDPDARRADGGRVRVVRMPSMAFRRFRMLGRLTTYLTYVVLAFLRGLAERRHDVVVAMTDPPVIGLVACSVAWLQRAPFVYVIQDLYPDVAVALGQLRNRVLAGVMERLSMVLFRRADRVVAISRTARERLVDKGIPEAKVRVISNWADTDLLEPEPKRNSFSLRHGLADRFVVMYSGNVGLSQNLEVMVEAACDLRDLEDLTVVIVGDGASKARLAKKVRALGVPNLVFMPRQPVREMRYSFAAADVFLVPLARGLEGVIFPSKVFGIMASGRPFIAAIDAASEVAQIARKYACGLVVPPGSPRALAEAIRYAYRNRDEIRRLGERGRRAVETEYSARASVAQYAELLAEVVERRLASDNSRLSRS